MAWSSLFFFFSSRRRHTRFSRDWSSDVCSSDLYQRALTDIARAKGERAVEQAPPPGRALRQQHNIAPEVEPDLQQQHRPQIPQIDKAEHGHGRTAVRSQIHLQ